MKIKLNQPCPCNSGKKYKELRLDKRRSRPQHNVFIRGEGA
jgi:SEC-C motif